MIPAYNESERILPTLQKLLAYLDTTGWPTEIIVVENGSTDDTYAVVARFGEDDHRVRAIRAPRRGKGIAVKTGMSEASGSVRLFCDADLSMPVSEIEKLLAKLGDGYDIAIASREAAGARRHGEPGYRHLMGRVFNFVVQLVTVSGINDTQCGFKLFTDRSARALYPLQLTDGWAFDVEILFLARKLGFRVAEVPIDWYYEERSKINPLRDSVRMFQEAINVRLNDFRGAYRQHQLAMERSRE